MFNKERKERYRKREKNYRKMTKIQKACTRAKQSEKTGTEHTRVRIVELREKDKQGRLRSSNFLRFLKHSRYNILQLLNRGLNQVVG